MADLEDRLVRCFALVFPELDEKGIREATMTSVAEWDSIATVTLINVVEEEFGIQFDIEDLEDLTSFHQFSNYLRGKRVKLT